MRVSAGFFVTGLSGNILIQIFPPFLIKRVSATRADSICWLVIHAGSSAISPYCPKDISVPPLALPFMRPLWVFLYFTLFGINIVVPFYPAFLYQRNQQVFLQ